MKQSVPEKIKLFLILCQGLSSFYSEMMRGLGASTRLWELVDRVPAIPYDSGIHPEAGLRGQISFQDVHFAYPTRPDNVIFKGMPFLSMFIWCVSKIVMRQDKFKVLIFF